MTREKELQDLIFKYRTELKVIQDHDYAYRELDRTFNYAKDAGVTEEESLSLVDAVYHPDGIYDKR